MVCGLTPLGGSTTIVPASPPLTCSSAMPCRCAWYQYVPAAWWASIWKWYLQVPSLAAAVDLKTLSTSGSTSRPWVWKLVSPIVMPIGGAVEPAGGGDSIARWWLR